MNSEKTKPPQTDASKPKSQPRGGDDSNKSGKPAKVERQPRRRDNGEQQQQQQRNGANTNANNNGTNAKRSPAPAAAGAAPRKPAPAKDGKPEDSAVKTGTNNTQVINYNKDIASAPMWTKGAAVSFADMVRQKNEAKKTQADAEAPQQQQGKKGGKKPEQQQNEEASKEQEAKPADATPVAPAIERVDAAPATSVEQPAASKQAAAPPTPQQQPVAPPKPEPVPEPVPATTYYVLEVDRADPVKLPIGVVKAAGIATGLYTFSAQAGKPPTPPTAPVSQPQQTLYRPNVANLDAAQRQWPLPAAETRIPQQQQPWGFDYWNAGATVGDRAVAAQRFQPQMQYNSYAPPAQAQSQAQARPNFYPARMRQPDMTEASLRAVPNTSAGFNRAMPSSNGGGVW